MKLSNEEIVQIFFDISRSIRNYGKYHTGKLNPLTGQYRCLFLLDNVGTISQKKMAALLEIRSTSLSEVLAKLEVKGFVKRTQAAEDKRTFLISLTDAGETEIQRHRSSRSAAHTELVAALTKEEKEQFAHLLTKIKNYYIAIEENQDA